MRVKERARRRVRKTLMGVGRRVSPALLQKIAAAHSYVELGQWVGGITGDVPHYGSRFDLFGRAVAEITGAAPLYLEFGVYRGETLAWWSQHLTQPGARLVGFDSFQGLPEDWKHSHTAGHFAADVPQIHDPRVSFEVGWFQETVPNYELPDHDQLVVNVDSDLYSSAVLVLDRLSPWLVPGSLIYFDELNDRDHELKAFREFLADTGRSVEALGTSAAGINWLFRVTGSP